MKNINWKQVIQARKLWKKYHPKEKKLTLIDVYKSIDRYKNK